jgi:hypothetical protein
MGMFDKFKTSTAIDRLLEEKLYEQVAQELKAGKKREGIWVKAMAKSDGDLNKAESLYIELRVQAIRDEILATQKASEYLNQVEQEGLIKGENLENAKQSAVKWINKRKRKRSNWNSRAERIFILLIILLSLALLFFVVLL